MDKDDILQRFNSLLDDTIAKGDNDAMETSRTMFKKAIGMLTNLDIKKANDFVDCFEGSLKYYNYLTETEANKILDTFVNCDGSRGAKWRNPDEMFNVLQTMSYPIENAPYYNRYALFVVINKFASDNGNVIYKWFGSDREKFFTACYELAVSQLEDKDRPDWVRWYFNLVDKT